MDPFRLSRPAHRLHPAGLVRPLVTVLAFLLSLSTFAQTAGMWGQRGISRRFVVSGNVLYAADGRGVAAYDVSAANAVTRMDVEWSDDETFDLALMGATDLVVATSAGVERFSVAADGTVARRGFTDETGPVSRIAANATYAAAAAGNAITILERDGDGLRVARRLSFTNSVTALAFHGQHLFVAVDRQPLRVFVPPSATAAAVLPAVNAAAMAVANDVLWTASASDGLTGVDISRPTEPKVLGSAGRNELRLAGVAAAGTRVYAFTEPDTLYTFDVSRPSEPRLIGTMKEWVNVIAASGARVFVSGVVVQKAEGIEFDPGYIPRGTGKPVRVFEGGALIAEAHDYAGPVTGVWTDGSIAYVIDPPYLRVLDVSKTSEPREITALEIPNLQDRIRVKNGRAVIYGRAFVNYLDVSNPLRPRLLGTWDAQGYPPSNASILRQRVLEANNHSGMHVIDFTDPARAVQIGGRKWHYHDVVTSDDAIYALLEDSMLVAEVAEERDVVDRTFVPLQFEQVDTIPPNASQPELLLVRATDGLRLYSIAGEDRFDPRELDELPDPDLGLFATGDGNAYIMKDGYLHVVNTTPALSIEPTEWRATVPMQISVAGGKVVVADFYSVRIYGPDTAPPPEAPPARRRAVRH